MGSVRELGCDYMRGVTLARPMPREELYDLFA